MFKVLKSRGIRRQVVGSFNTLEEASAKRKRLETADPSAKYLLRFPPVSERHRADEWHREAAKYDDPE